MQSNYSTVSGDLLQADEQYILHQCNCVTRRSLFLARQIFDHFPDSDVYKHRKSPSEPGTIEIRGRVIALFAQYMPGKVKTETRRLQWFVRCMKRVGDIAGLKSVAIPWGIGCGSAGGSWMEYEREIRKFSEENPNVKVRIYRLSETGGLPGQK